MRVGTLHIIVIVLGWINYLRVIRKWIQQFLYKSNNYKFWQEKKKKKMKKKETSLSIALKFLLCVLVFSFNNMTLTYVVCKVCFLMFCVDFL